MWINSNQRSVRDYRRVSFADFHPNDDRNPFMCTEKSMNQAGLNLPSDCTVYLPLNGDFQNKIDGSVFTNKYLNGWPPDQMRAPAFITQGGRKVAQFNGDGEICHTTDLHQYARYVLGKRNFFWKDFTTVVPINGQGPNTYVGKYNWAENNNYPQGSAWDGRPNEISWYSACKRPQVRYGGNGYVFNADVDFTAACWYKYSSTTGYNVLMYWGTGLDWGSGGGAFITHRDNARICIVNADQVANLNQLADINGTKAYGLVSGSATNNNAWHFAVARYKTLPTVGSNATSSRYLELWIDNVLQDFTPNHPMGYATIRPDMKCTLQPNWQPTTVSPGAFSIGTPCGNIDQRWMGQIAEAMFFTRYLEDNELTELYTRGQRSLGLI